MHRTTVSSDVVAECLLNGLGAARISNDALRCRYRFVSDGLSLDSVRT